MPPAPYIDEQTGQRFYNVRQAAQIIEAIGERTLYKWAAHGSTPFGFELDVEREPVTHHRSHNQGEAPPLHLREVRLLIPEEKVFALKQILNAEPRRPGPISRDDMEALESAARRFRSPFAHLPNSPTPS